MTYKIALTNDFTRARAKTVIDQAPPGHIVTIAEPKRTLDQNDKMWAMLSDVALAKPLGRRHTPDDWKAIAMNACSWECAFLEGLDGRPFPVGFRSSKLSKSMMSTLIDWLQAFGDEQGVKWSEQQQEAA